MVGTFKFWAWIDTTSLQELSKCENGPITDGPQLNTTWLIQHKEDSINQRPKRDKKPPNRNWYYIMG